MNKSKPLLFKKGLNIFKFKIAGWLLTLSYIRLYEIYLRIEVMCNLVGCGCE